MIDISEHARKAAETGAPVAARFTTESGDPVDFEVSANGSVRALTPGWHIEAKDGQITALYPVPADPFTTADQGVISMIEMHRRFTRNGATEAEAAYLTVAFCRDARNQPQEGT